MTKIQEVADVLSEMKGHELAQKWLNNDFIKMTIAESYDYWLEGLAPPMPLSDFVEQYLAHAHLLGGIFSQDTSMPQIDI